jgi:hypothetical protein
MTITELDLILMFFPSFIGTFLALVAYNYIDRKYDNN